MTKQKLKNAINKRLQKMVTLQLRANIPQRTARAEEWLSYAGQQVNSGNLEAGVMILEGLVSQCPKVVDLYIYLCNLYIRIGYSDKAIPHIQQALKLEGNKLNVLLAASEVYCSQLQEQKMYEYACRAITLYPKNAAANNQYGFYLMLKGDGKTAKQHFQTTLKLDPENAAAYWNLVNVDKNPLSDFHISTMLGLLKDEKIDDTSKAIIGFSLANSYGKLGDIEREFELLDFANTIISQQVNWNPDQHLNAAKKMIDVANSTFVARLSAQKIKSFSPIVIATMPRSGSTLIEQILSVHKDVTSCGESDIFYKSFNSCAENLPPGLRLTEMSDEQVASFVSSSHHLIVEEFGKLVKPNQLVIDKSLSNFTEIGKILSIYPNAKVIYSHRNPMAIALSCYQHYFTSSNQYTYKLENIAVAYQAFVLIMDHWLALFPNNIFRIDYEDLTANQENVTRNMLEFCDLKWQSECLQFHDNNRMVFTASNAQVRECMHSNANERWKNYLEYLKPVSETLKLNTD